MRRVNSQLLRGFFVASFLFTTLGGLGGCRESGNGAAYSAAGAPPKGEYAFIRAQKNLVRTESRTGRTWIVALNGDGGWRAVGGPAPDPVGREAYPGRYRVSFIPPMKSGLTPDSRSNTPTGLLLRLDEASGRTWVMDVGGETDWLVFEGDSPSPVEAEEDPVPLPEATPEKSVSPTPSGGPVPDLSSLPSPADQPAVDIEGQQLSENLKAFSDAINKPHLPTEIRVWAVEQLGRYPADEAGPLLLPALDDDDPAVVVAAIRSANRLGFAPAIPRIVNLQNHPNAEIKAEAQRTVQTRS